LFQINRVFQLNAAKEELASKTDSLTTLQTEMEELKASLESAQSEAQVHLEKIKELEESLVKSESQLKDVTSQLAGFSSQQPQSDSVLQAVKDEVGAPFDIHGHLSS
jgi:conserved oligomeric Golgi complex subunit 6